MAEHTVELVLKMSSHLVQFPGVNIGAVWYLFREQDHIV